MTDSDDLDSYTALSLLPGPTPYFEYLGSKYPVAELPNSDVFAVTECREVIEPFWDFERFSVCSSEGGPLSLPRRTEER